MRQKLVRLPLLLILLTPLSAYARGGSAGEFAKWALLIVVVFAIGAFFSKRK